MHTLPKALRIGIIRGGPIHHNRPYQNYSDSLKSGGYVLSNFLDEYRPVDILISRDGVWHMKGIEKTPEQILKSVDVVFNTLNPSHIDDFRLHELFDNNGVAYVGSDKFSSAFSKNRKLAKEAVFASGIKTALYTVVEKGEDVLRKAKEIFQSITHPLSVKPLVGTGPFASHVATSFGDFTELLTALLEHFPNVIVEEHIPGKHFSSLVLEDFRGQESYTFSPVYTTSDGQAVTISKEESREIQEMAGRIHDILKFSHYSLSDFIVSPKRGVYFKEANPYPLLDENSATIRSLQTVGVPSKEFINHLIYLALQDKSLV